MADVASQLASDFLAAQGWACIRIEACDASRKCVVTVDGVDARDEPGSRIWLLRQRADRVVAAFFSRCQQARRRPRGAGLIVNSPVTATEGMIRDVAGGLGIALVGDDFIGAQLALVTGRIQNSMSGITKGLAREYKTARASGTPLPGYDDWLVARLRPALQAGLGS